MMKKNERCAVPTDVRLDFKPAAAILSKPAPGRLGRPIKLISNCFPLIFPTGHVYHYDVKIIRKPCLGDTTEANREDDTSQGIEDKYRCLGTKRNREVMYRLLSTNQFKESCAVYDGRQNLYTREPLDILCGEGGYQCDIEMTIGRLGNKYQSAEVFQLTLNPVKKKDSNDFAISLDAAHALYAGQVDSVPQETVMALETVLRHAPCMRFTPIGRSFFYPQKDRHPLGIGKSIWFGYHQSLRLGQRGPMVNIDVTATTFTECTPVLNYIAGFLNKDIRALQGTIPLLPADIYKLGKELRNLKVEVTHTQNYRRKYRVDSLTEKSANEIRFILNEEEITVSKYFEERYKRLKFPHLPCIETTKKGSGKVYLPVEVCEIVAKQHCNKQLTHTQNSEMIKFTAKTPKERFSEISNIVLEKANYSEDPFLKKFGMEVPNEFIKVEGRVLPAPSIVYGQERVIPKTGSWNMVGMKFNKSVVINSWVLLSFEKKYILPKEKLKDFAEKLVEIAQKQSITIRQPDDIQIIDNLEPFIEIEYLFRNIGREYKAQLIVIVIPSETKTEKQPGRSKTLYKEIKAVGDITMEIATQCIRSNTIIKKCTGTTMSNICLKINAKMDGVNSLLVPEEIPKVFDDSIIIIGADVNHSVIKSDKPKKLIKPSIAAVVGSLDASNPSRYTVTISSQMNKNSEKKTVELILNLKEMVVELLRVFYRNTGHVKPSKIIFYRDGVSEGQFEEVQKHEIKWVREACATLQKDYSPRLTFIVVQKRHHVRFMPEDPRDGVGAAGNAPPGSTVDTIVTHPLNNDFFLQSQYGLKGTSRPMHYTTLADDNDFTSDQLQKLAYHLCHTYARTTKSVSSPAPVRYAHDAAYRARLHLEYYEEQRGGVEKYDKYPLSQSEIKEAITSKMKNMYFI